MKGYTYMKKGQFNLSITGVWFGIISAGCCFLSRVLFKSPIDMIHKLAGINIIPPIWLLNLMSVIFFFLLGYCAGAVTAATAERMNTGERELKAYRGGIFIICTFFLALIWYPLFFFCGRLFIAFLISVAAMLSLIVALTEWMKVIPHASSVLLFICALYEFYIMFISLSAFLTV